MLRSRARGNNNPTYHDYDGTHLSHSHTTKHKNSAPKQKKTQIYTLNIQGPREARAAGACTCTA